MWKTRYNWTWTSLITSHPIPISFFCSSPSAFYKIDHYNLNRKNRFLSSRCLFQFKIFYWTWYLTPLQYIFFLAYVFHLLHKRFPRLLQSTMFLWQYFQQSISPSHIRSLSNAVSYMYPSKYAIRDINTGSELLFDSLQNAQYIYKNMVRYSSRQHKFWCVIESVSIK